MARRCQTQPGRRRPGAGLELACFEFPMTKTVWDGAPVIGERVCPGRMLGKLVWLL